MEGCEKRQSSISPCIVAVRSLHQAAQKKNAGCRRCGSHYFIQTMTTQDIRQLIADGKLYSFYKSKEWLRLKDQVLRDAHYECAICKSHGIITRYDVAESGAKTLLSTVHHVCHVREHPELALSRTYKDQVTGEIKPNLIPVCKACHNRLHPEKIRWARRTHDDRYDNQERW